MIVETELVCLAAMSPLAEGRELKSPEGFLLLRRCESPLAEGRELKSPEGFLLLRRWTVAPRGGA